MSYEIETPPPVTEEAVSATAATREWLLTDGRDTGSVTAVIEGLASRLIDTGVPIHKMMVGIRQLHPQLFALQFRWDRETGRALEIQREHGIETTPVYRSIPIPLIFSGAPMVRQSLRDEETVAFPYVYMPDLRGLRLTEMVAFPLPFSRNQPQVFGIMTDRPGGFTTAQLSRAAAILPSLAAVLELVHLRSTAASLLDIYVGRDAGHRILAGTIKRGDGDTIRAAIWFCDLAGFTAMSEVASRDRVIATLNTFFDIMATAVQTAGGEILKFMGDGLLAIFRLPDDTSAQTELSRRILSAAREACLAIERLNLTRAAAHEGTLSFGISLHVGNVMYGNIGAAQRLDFTVIGPAVNRAARLEELSRRLGRQVIVSSAFAATAQTDLPMLGRFRLRGVAKLQKIYTLPGC